MNKPTKLSALLIFCLAFITLAACQPVVQVDDAKVAYCASLEAYNEAVAAVRALPEDASVEEFEAAVEAVTDARDELQSSTWELADAQTQALEESYDVLQDSLDSIEGGTTLGEARATIETSMATYEATYEEVREVSCE